jgi:hypothetical protein
MSSKEPVHVEFSFIGRDKAVWVRNVVSHESKEIIDAWEGGTSTITLVDSDGSNNAVDLSTVCLIRLQNDEVFQRRSEYVRRT